MAAETLGGEARSLRNVDVGGVPAVHLHAERGVSVFGDRFFGDAADLIERGTPEDGAGTAEEGRVPEIVTVLDDAVEEFSLVRGSCGTGQDCARRDRVSKSDAASAACRVCCREGTSRA